MQKRTSPAKFLFGWSMQRFVLHHPEFADMVVSNARISCETRFGQRTEFYLLLPSTTVSLDSAKIISSRFYDSLANRCEYILFRGAQTSGANFPTINKSVRYESRSRLCEEHCPVRKSCIKSDRQKIFIIFCLFPDILTKI